ncbi:mitochondrial thiamine pyrophosphate carrier-like [Daphnia carinata]|uniref:mitochondrial thiamine pyrophosphate carrier-like n=1 Tax=Daphnia carinata TaxID=120202 RepID=UPI00257C4E4F|nr:mitochondrial thiamine pyrophosphate carrier-like [Daphnia carinata]
MKFMEDVVKKRTCTVLSERGLAGAVGGCATRFLCQPFDVLKIRFQVQIEPISKSSGSAVYRGIIQGLQHIVKGEGWTALWKGHVAAQALSATFGFVQFGLFEAITTYAFEQSPSLKSVQSGVNFSAGLGAGCLATIISFPFDTIRTRLIVQGEPKIYKGVMDVVSKMWAKEGALSLYHGLSPTLIQIGPYTGCQFAIYKFLIEMYEEAIDGKGAGLKSLTCGAVAGAVAKTLVYPLDLGKKRMQLQGFCNRHQYKGLLDCLATTVRNEGLAALLKGLSPSLLKAVFSSALQFYFYETTLEFLTRSNVRVKC